jgi:hypothetical protein
MELKVKSRRCAAYIALIEKGLLRMLLNTEGGEKLRRQAWIPGEAGAVRGTLDCSAMRKGTES